LFIGTDFIVLKFANLLENNYKMRIVMDNVLFQCTRGKINRLLFIKLLICLPWQSCWQKRIELECAI